MRHHLRRLSSQDPPPRRLRAAALLLSCAALIASDCGGPGPLVSLSRLVADQSAYAGHQVAVRGTIVAFNDASGPYFVIQDNHQDRVEVFPRSWIAPYSGRTVTVAGTFHVDQTTGRWIQLRSVSPAIRSTVHAAGRRPARPLPV